MSCCRACSTGAAACGTDTAAAARSPSWPAHVVGAFEWPWEREAREQREQRAAYEARKRAETAKAREAERRRTRELQRAQRERAELQRKADAERKAQAEREKKAADEAARAAAAARKAADAAAREREVLLARLDEQRRAAAEAGERAQAEQLEQLAQLAEESGEGDELEADAFPESVAVAGWSMGGAPGPGGDAWPWPMTIVGGPPAGGGKRSGGRGGKGGGEGLGGRLGGALGGARGLAADAPPEVRQVDDAISAVVEQVLPFVPYGDVVREVHEARRGAMYGTSARAPARAPARPPARKGGGPAGYASGAVARLQGLVRSAARGDKRASRELAELKARASAGNVAARREWAAAVATMRGDDEATDRAYVRALGRRGA